MAIRTIAVLAAGLIALAGQASAGACDYAPSRLAGKTAAAVGATLAGGGAVAGAGVQAAGYYILVHGGSDLTMLTSAAAGAGSMIAGAAGAVGAVLTAPATIIVGGLTLIAVGSFEGICYFQVERVTDPYEVREVVESIAAHDGTVSLVKTEDGIAMALDEAGEVRTYLLRNLYIADGELKHRDLFRNTNLGPVFLTSENTEK
jgi:hypothetical protein